MSKHLRACISLICEIGVKTTKGWPGAQSKAFESYCSDCKRKSNEAAVKNQEVIQFKEKATFEAIYSNA